MQQPLAYRMRPTRIEDIVGQQDLVGPGKIIDRMVRAKMLSSMILYGPPGTGKTSIASAIAGSTKYAFRMLNAATDAKKDLQVVAEEAKMSGTVVLLLDEIHRLDKTKQDFLLPLLENGSIILIGRRLKIRISISTRPFVPEPKFLRCIPFQQMTSKRPYSAHWLIRKRGLAITLSPLLIRQSTFFRQQPMVI